MWYDVLKTHKAQLTITSVVSLIIGGTAGYLISVKKLESKYAEIAETEIADAKLFYGELANKTIRTKLSSPIETFAELHPEEVSPLLDEATTALHAYQGRLVDGEFVPDPVVRTNVFATHQEIIDEVVVIVEVDETKPFLITEEVWQEAEPGYNQITLSYYAGDAVLTDEDEKVVDNVETVIGIDNLERFGEGTGDENTMFIRNHDLKMDFEVVRSDGKYIHEVLGLEHSGERRHRDRGEGPRKFRHQDE